MEGCQDRRHHYNHCAYDVIYHHVKLVYVSAKLEASGVISVSDAIYLCYDARDGNEHPYPQYNTSEKYMDSLEGAYSLPSEVKRYQAHDEDDDIKDEGHVHVDVDHGADQLTPPATQDPGLCCIIVNPEG